MTHARLWLASAIIIIVLVVGFVLSVPHTSEVIEKVTTQSKESRVPLVQLHDTFRKGVHTITGSIEVLNACAGVTAESSRTGDESILVAISVSEDSNVCLQIPTDISFSTTVPAPANIPITATINGAPATTSQI